MGNAFFTLGGMLATIDEKAARQKVHNWNASEQDIKAWKEGKTGVPYIDANMRELVLTGYMSNRGRQVTYLRLHS